MVDDELPKDLELIVENNYHLNIKEVNSTNCDHINYIREHCVVLYTIKNVGFNTAVDVSLAIGDMTLKDAMCVNTNEEINIVLIFDSSFYKKKVDLTFTYFDIYSIAKYKQDESVYIDDEIELLPSITQFGDDRLTKPVEINKK